METKMESSVIAPVVIQFTEDFLQGKTSSAIKKTILHGLAFGYNNRSYVFDRNYSFVYEDEIAQYGKFLILEMLAGKISIREIASEIFSASAQLRISNL